MTPIIAAVIIDQKIKALNEIGCREYNGGSFRPNQLILARVISNVVASVGLMPSILGCY